MRIPLQNTVSYVLEARDLDSSSLRLGDGESEGKRAGEGEGESVGDGVLSLPPLDDGAGVAVGVGLVDTTSTVTSSPQRHCRIFQ